LELKDPQKAHVLMDFWDANPVWPPSDMSPHQRFAVFGLEPWIGYRTDTTTLRRALLPRDGTERPAIDVLAFWFAQKPDIEINYAYSSGLDLDPPPDWTREDRLAEIHKRLSAKLRLNKVPVFDKKRYYASLRPDQVQAHTDYRGADVAFFISNCDASIWRTQYLDILLPLLEAMGVEVDSWGGCFPGIGRGVLNRGWGEDVSTVQDASYPWPMRESILSNKTEPMDTSDYRPYKSKLMNGVKKGEMMHHYKVLCLTRGLTPRF
jgi:hypothetical protein